MKEMIEINLHLPNSLHRMAKELAKEDGISMNQFVTSALAEKVAALTTEAYIEERAARASKAKFLAAMSKVTYAEEPDECHQLC